MLFRSLFHFTLPLRLLDCAPFFGPLVNHALHNLPQRRQIPRCAHFRQRPVTIFDGYPERPVFVIFDGCAAAANIVARAFAPSIVSFPKASQKGPKLKSTPASTTW